MSIRVELRAPDVGATIRGSRDAFAAIQRGVEPNIAAAIVYVRILKTLLNIPGTGVTRTSKGRTHTASRPGQPPAPDFGLLKGGVGFAVMGQRVGVGVGGPRAQPTSSGRPVWEILERGSRFIEPRPFVRPAIAIGQSEASDEAVKVLRARALKILKLRRRGRR